MRCRHVINPLYGSAGKPRPLNRLVASVNENANIGRDLPTERARVYPLTLSRFAINTRAFCPPLPVIPSHARAIIAIRYLPIKGDASEEKMRGSIDLCSTYVRAKVFNAPPSSCSKTRFRVSKKTSTFLRSFVHAKTSFRDIPPRFEPSR